MKKFEIFGFSGTPEEFSEYLQRFWHEHITYRGKEFFDSIYIEQIVPLAERHIWCDCKQESYLGYLASDDIFVSGWDTWVDDDWDEARNVVFIRFNQESEKFELCRDSKFLNMDYRGKMYSRFGMYPQLKIDFPNLLDIRLD